MIVYIIYRDTEYTTTTISVLNHHVEFVDKTSKLQLGSVWVNRCNYIIEDIYKKMNKFFVLGSQIQTLNFKIPTLNFKFNLPATWIEIGIGIVIVIVIVIVQIQLATGEIALMRLYAIFQWITNPFNGRNCTLNSTQA